MADNEGQLGCLAPSKLHSFPLPASRYAHSVCEPRGGEFHPLPVLAGGPAVCSVMIHTEIVLSILTLYANNNERDH